MRSKLPTRIDVVRKEEKEAHLIAFIRADLEAAQVRASAGNGLPAARRYTLVVRSLNSPVALALAGLAAELTAAAVSLRVVVVQPVLGADVGLAGSEAAGIAPLVSEARVLRDIRFLDAHEQLWLNDATVWFGDCMRREPGKRDAYECFASDNAELARWAALSFERLWAQGECLGLGGDAAAAGLGVEDHVCAAIAQQGEPVSAVEAATRH